MHGHEAADTWRSEWDSNPRTGITPLHDFQSCSLDQLGHRSAFPRYYSKARRRLSTDGAPLARCCAVSYQSRGQPRLSVAAPTHAPPSNT